MTPAQKALNDLMPVLRTGVALAEVHAAARLAALDVEHRQALFYVLLHPHEFKPIQARKAAWILNHAFQLDDRGFLRNRAHLMEVLDVHDDPSVQRELLKLLAQYVWLDVESEAERTELLELGIGLLYVHTLPLAMHYAGMQIAFSRARQPAEFKEALDGLAHLRSNASSGKSAESATPLHRCIARYEKRFRQKLARTKSPS